jgi:hypothetical protein
MAVVQVNTPGMASTDPGYISSISVMQDDGSTVVVRTPNATTGQITVDAKAATKLVQDYSKFKLISG